MADPAGQLTIVDFSFSELDATPRQMDLDVAELLASLAVLDGEDRVVCAVAGALGAGRLARAVPLLQPLALSAATRKAVAAALRRARPDPGRGRRQEPPELGYV